MIRYRSTKVVDARKLSAHNRGEVVKWAGDNVWFYDSNADSELYVQSEMGGGVPATDGDWIVKDEDGFRVMKSAEFWKAFEVIELDEP